MARLAPVAAAAAAGLLVLSACGGAGDDSSGGDGTSTETSTDNGNGTGTGTGTNGNGNGSNGNGDGDDGFPYVPWGPDDPPIPTQYAVLAATSDAAPQCGTLAGERPDGDFWSLAVDVCRAVVGEADWPDTTSVPDPPTADNDYIACLDEELGSMLQAALQWHVDHPGQEPEVDYPDRETTSACQYRIYDVVVLDEDDLVQDEGHPDGVGLAVVFNANRGQDPTVTVDGEATEPTGDFVFNEPEGDGLRTLVVLAPAADEDRTAKVEVQVADRVLSTDVSIPARNSTEPTATGTTATTEPEPAPTGTETTGQTSEPTP